MVISNYEVGDRVSPSVTIKSFGSKYVTCTSITGYVHDVKFVHDVKYSYIDFAFNFMNG